jgi:hypothetical protein
MLFVDTYIIYSKSHGSEQELSDLDGTISRGIFLTREYIPIHTPNDAQRNCFFDSAKDRTNNQFKKKTNEIR